MDQVIKTYADAGDVNRLKYIFVDCLDVDPTFEEYREDYEYCKKNVPELFVPHMELMPISHNEDDWDEEYWAKLKTDLLKNFSSERFEHMIQTARVIHGEKIKKLINERKSRNLEQRQSSEFQESYSKDKENLLHETKSVVPQAEYTMLGTDNCSIWKMGNHADYDISENTQTANHLKNTETVWAVPVFLKEKAKKAIDTIGGMVGNPKKAIEAYKKYERQIDRARTLEEEKTSNTWYVYKEILVSQKRSYRINASKEFLNVIDYEQDDAGDWIETGQQIYEMIRQKTQIEQLEKQTRWKPCQGSVTDEKFSVYFLVNQNGRFTGYYNVEEKSSSKEVKQYFYFRKNNREDTWQRKIE